MSLNNQPTPDSAGQSTGCDPKSSKRNSGLFAFLKWFKPSTSRESIDADLQISQSSSCDSLSSTHSAGTVASFSFVPPSAYKKCVSEKCIVLGPETDTYKARLKQRDKRRENDKNLTLRKKYNLFFNRDTLLKPKSIEEDENSKSLPLMTRAVIEPENEIKMHRRTFSESSKVKKSGSYVHVKGKRKAPQPPTGKDSTATSSLRRKKRLAPIPPPVNADKVIKVLQKSNNTTYLETDIICNDSLKLDHGILKSAKNTDEKSLEDQNNSTTASSQTPNARPNNNSESPVSPRPWYKRNVNRDSILGKKEKIDHIYQPIQPLPEVSFKRNSSLDLTLEDAKIEKKKEEKRKSGLSFLTNISELDREAQEIIKKRENEKSEPSNISELPEFMRPKECKTNTDSWVPPKRKTAKDLIAKFNAITNVSKVTVFGASQKDAKLFGKQISLDETKRKQVSLLESHKKRIEEIDKKNTPLMKSESASAIKTKSETPKTERKSWKCPKCSNDNEYWRIICHVCSAIKPYFDDFSSNRTELKMESKTASPITSRKENSPPKKIDFNLERSKTQIGFSALVNHNLSNISNQDGSVILQEKTSNKIEHKKEEKEKLKKMLIEMKNSLPKRKSNLINKQNSRASVILETSEQEKTIVQSKTEQPVEQKESVLPKEESILEQPEKTQGEKVAEILIGTRTTIYENIKIRKTDYPKPIKVSSSVQTSGVKKQDIPPSSSVSQIKDQAKYTYKLMKPKDFEDIYADTNAKSASRVYANLARSDELSLFFNMPKNFSVLENNNPQKCDNFVDTIEINRLLKRLEMSIAKGDLTDAAIFAKELAQLKVNCSVIRQKPPKYDDVRNGIQIEMYVEDKLSHRGPFPLIVSPDQTVAQLKKQVEEHFEIPADYQKWILGKELVTDDNSTLRHHSIISEGCPVFLYLVAPDKITKKTIQDKQPDSIIQNLPSTSQFILPLNEHKSSTKKDVSTNSEENNTHLIKTSHPNTENKEETGDQTKLEAHIPKIVNVIPKITESKSKTDISIATTQVNKADYKAEKAETIASKPIAIDDLKQSTDSTEPISKNSQEVKPQIKYVFPTIQNSYGISKTSNSNGTETVVHESKQSKQGQNHSTHNDDTIMQFNKPSSTSNKQVQNLELSSSHEPPTAVEEDFEEFDSNTLKPIKEWECHLCTLLNPISSNVCAVCATVRLLKNQVQPIKKQIKRKDRQPKLGTSVRSDETYLQLINLDNEDLVKNVDLFECLVCFLEIAPQEGITLRECLHQFCKPCLSQTIEFAEEAEIKCPYRDEEYSCNIALQDREVKALVSAKVYEAHLAKSVAQAENRTDKSFHCKTPDCTGWCIFEDNVNDFPCPVCRKTNCLTCQAIHAGMNCKQYQEKMKDESEIDDDARRTKNMLDEMVNKGEAIECPSCKIILMKKWGCDWLRCSMCKTEICWVTRGPRWGPAGKGDTSGGCQCGVNGVKCHPKCNYCH